MTVHLNAGRNGDVQVLSDDSIKAMQTIQAHGRKLDVGLGWYRRHADRPSHDRYLEHLGGGGGFFNMMRIHPEDHTGITLMGNATSYDHQRVVAAIAHDQTWPCPRRDVGGTPLSP